MATFTHKFTYSSIRLSGQPTSLFSLSRASTVTFPLKFPSTMMGLSSQPTSLSSLRRASTMAFPLQFASSSTRCDFCQVPPSRLTPRAASKLLVSSECCKSIVNPTFGIKVAERRANIWFLIVAFIAFFYMMKKSGDANEDGDGKKDGNGKDGHGDGNEDGDRKEDGGNEDGDRKEDGHGDGKEDGHGDGKDFKRRSNELEIGLFKSLDFWHISSLVLSFIGLFSIVSISLGVTAKMCSDIQIIYKAWKQFEKSKMYGVLRRKVIPNLKRKVIPKLKARLNELLTMLRTHLNKLRTHLIKLITKLRHHLIELFYFIQDL